MKKILIIILIVLIILLGAAWAYLLINGAPKSISDFTKNFFGTNAVTNAPTPAPQGAPVAPTTNNNPGERTIGIHAELVKITDKPVAGAVIVSKNPTATSSTSSTTPGSVLRYMLKGTGHVYEVSLDTGIEKRITNQVIPQVIKTVWSPDGTHAVLETDKDGYRGDTLLATLSPKDSGTSIDTETLPLMDNISFSATGDTLYYTQENTDGGISGFVRVLRTGAVQQLFTIPFKEASMLWDIWAGKNHFVYTKPATGFTGFIYLISSSGALEKLNGAKDLSALRASKEALVVNKDLDEGPYSIFVDIENKRSTILNIETLPEKCAGTRERLWCGTTESAKAGTFPVAWYQGIVQYADSLWSIDTISGRSQKILDPETVAREQIDVTDMQFGANVLLFRNKRDDALWLYNLIKY